MEIDVGLYWIIQCTVEGVKAIHPIIKFPQMLSIIRFNNTFVCRAAADVFVSFMFIVAVARLSRVPAHDVVVIIFASPNDKSK